jgi:hypothetical protein
MDPAAVVGDQPVMKIGCLVDVLAHRPLDDQLLDDPVAADGGARGGQRGDLGRPFKQLQLQVDPDKLRARG